MTEAYSTVDMALVGFPLDNVSFLLCNEHMPMMSSVLGT